MNNPKAIKIRNLILEEHRAGTRQVKAVENICDKLGHDAVTIKIVAYWYNRFDSGDTSVYDKKTKEYRNEKTSMDVSEFVSEASMLFPFKQPRMVYKLITNDGRLGFLLLRFSVTAGKGATLCMSDLLYGNQKGLQNASNIFSAIDHINQHWVQVKMVDNEHFLIFLGWLPQLALFKLNHDAFKLDVLQVVDIDASLQCGQLIVDEKGTRKFMIYHMNGSFLTGHLDGTQIIIRKLIMSLPDCLQCMKLEGSTLSCLRYSGQGWEIRSFDLDKVKPKLAAKIPLECANGEEFAMSPSYNLSYVWSGSRLYVPAKLTKLRTKIVYFDTKTLIWTDTHLKFPGQLRGMFIDENEILTAQVLLEIPKDVNNLYRIPLKKPDSLKNLAWMFIVNHEEFFGSNFLYDIAGLISDDLQSKIYNY